MKKAAWMFFGVPSLTLLAAISPANAQDKYPTRPLRLLVGFSAGGGQDVVARIIAKELAEALAQPVTVENRVGANGVIAAEAVVKAPPDGYTLLHYTNNDAVNVSMYRKLPYDTFRDLAPVTALSSSPYLLGVHPSLPVRNVGELIALGKARPGQLSYASSGTGSGIHLSTELFNKMAGIDVVHVPYKGGAPALIDLAGGQVQLGMASVGSYLPHIGTGRIRILAVTSAARSSLLPDVPTVAESGLPGYEASTWNATMVPARTPETIIARLNHEIVTALASAQVKELLSRQSAEQRGGKPEEFARYLKTEVDKWAGVVKAIGLRAD